jgi:hypothetical protein
MALTKVTYSMIQDAAINVRNYGASSSATATENLAAFKLAVTATPIGGTLYVPTDVAEYVIDTNGGESAAININKRMTVWIDGIVKSNFGAIQANPPTIFLVSGDDVTFTGSGIVEGDGAINQINTGTAGTSPSLIKITGDSFTMDGLTIRKPHKYGVNLYDAKYAKITNCNFTGGPTEYRDTAYFGINSYYGEKHIISNNQFYPTPDGGMFVQCIFVNSTNNMSIQGNIAEKPYEKLAYVVSSNNIISNNIVVGNTGFIPGTNQKGTIGPPIRNDGINSKVTNNFIYFCGGGISAIGGGSLDISNNTLMMVGQGGVAVFGGSVVYDYLSIRNNIMVCGNISGIIVGNGVQITPSTGSNFYFDVSHNQIIGFAPPDTVANVAAWTATTVIPYKSIIKPTVPNSRYYVTTGGGTTGSTEPTWPTTVGATVVDGTVTWTCAAYDNTVVSGIRMLGVNSGLINDRCMISNNNIDGSIYQGCRVGIYTSYMQNSIVSNNRMRCTVYNIYEDTGAGNRYTNNVLDTSAGAAVGIPGLAALSFGEGNVSNPLRPLVANITLPAGVATVTVSTTVMIAAPNALIMLSPTNSQAAAYMVANGIYAVISSPNVVITSGNGTNFAGTEQFNVQIIQ